MRPTSDDFEPRRDGWFEHRGVWDEVTVGTVIASRKRSERWECIAVAHGQQVEYGKTLYMRFREQTTGVEYTAEPRPKTSAVTILTQSPLDIRTAPPAEPTDTEAIETLIRELGAEVLATKDNVTGEITCPDYASGRTHVDDGQPRAISRGEIEHLRLAHGMSVNDDISLIDLTTLHGQAHDPRWPNIGKGGFPHRHVPEDLSIT